MNHHLILGTAGHIDHGKTTLVRLLTGIDTDRLPQEKARGITIELGFASLSLPSGAQIGVVDVPGHERFVRTMIAGSTGIDLVALIIAADEGVMPQTREHLAICDLLGIKAGVIVLTKADLVDEEMLELAREDARAATRDTFLRDAPIVATSANSALGVGELVRTLDALAGTVSAKSGKGPTRLNVDRVFSAKGFGTIVTGTLMDGSLATEQALTIYPAEIPTRARSVQVHGHPVEIAVAGQRTAVNIHGVERTGVRRGDVLASPAAFAPTRVLDVAYRQLETAPTVTRRRRLRLLIGTRDVSATLDTLSTASTSRKGWVPAQLRLQEPIVCGALDRFILRLPSPATTLGGGVVVDPLASRRKRIDAEQAGHLLELAESGMTLGERVAHLLALYSPRALALPELAMRLPAPLQPIDIGALQNVALIGNPPTWVLPKENLERATRVIEAKLDSFHRKNSAEAGIARGILVAEVGKELGLGGAAQLAHLDAVLDDLAARGRIAHRGALVALASFVPKQSGADAVLAPRITQLFQNAGLAPPSLAEASTALGVPLAPLKTAVSYLVLSGDLTRTHGDFYFHPAAIADLHARLVTFLRAHGEISMPEFKELAGVSRKYLIPLAEFFDTTKVTMRVGEKRVLRRPDAKA